ncbi:MAG: nitroreductase family protein, partial [Deltaproteobacteria bacterium]
MEVSEAIRQRRSLRGLKRFEVTDEILDALMEAAELAPSCANNQPWKYVFVKEEKKLEGIRKALSKGNYWAKRASLMITLVSKRDMDCVIRGRAYYKFSAGLSASRLILRAWDLGLVAHALAGYKPGIVRKVINLPKDLEIISLIAVGKHADNWKEILKEKHRVTEEKRPERKPRKETFFIDEYA